MHMHEFQAKELLASQEMEIRGGRCTDNCPAALSGNRMADVLIASPMSWYSGWAFGDLGKHVFETYTSCCVESMKGIEWLNKNREVQTVAIISFPGEYGGDGAAGAALAAEALGLEVVFDGTGQVTPPSADNPNPDQTAIVSQIVSTAPRASRKNVSAPTPPVRKLEPVPASSTFCPAATCSASSPEPLRRNTLGAAAESTIPSVPRNTNCWSR